MNREAIERTIPHRAPFLLLDRVVEQGEGWLLAAWTVPTDAEWFRGHFPERPIMPGVLLAEHAFQAAAVLISDANGGFSPEDGVPMLTRISDARYRRPVLPGETLTTRVEVDEVVGPAWYMKARIACGEQRVASLRFVLTASDAMGRLGL